MRPVAPSDPTVDGGGARSRRSRNRPSPRSHRRWRVDRSSTTPHRASSDTHASRPPARHASTQSGSASRCGCWRRRTNQASAAHLGGDLPRSEPGPEEVGAAERPPPLRRRVSSARPPPDVRRRHVSRKRRPQHPSTMRGEEPAEGAGARSVGRTGARSLGEETTSHVQNSGRSGPPVTTPAEPRAAMGSVLSSEPRRGQPRAPSRRRRPDAMRRIRGIRATVDLRLDVSPIVIRPTDHPT